MNETQEKVKCPYGLCDGDGVMVIGEFDDIEERPCACKVEKRDEYDSQLD